MVAAQSATPFVGTQPLTVLDVRSVAEFAAGHVERAINAPNGIDASVLAQLGARTGRVLLYCKTGKRSAAAMEQLARKGVTNVVNAGGLVEARRMIQHGPASFPGDPPEKCPTTPPGQGPFPWKGPPASDAGRPGYPLPAGRTCGISEFPPGGTSCNQIPSTLGGPGWISLGIDPRTNNRPHLRPGLAADRPLGRPDLQRPLSVVSGGGPLVHRDGVPEIRIGTGTPVRMLNVGGEDFVGGASALQVPTAAFLGVRIADIMRRIAGERGCRREDGKLVRPVQGLGGVDEACGLPDVDERLMQSDRALRTQQRTYRFLIPRGARIELSVQIAAWGEAYRPQHDGSEPWEDADLEGVDVGNFPLSLDGVFVGLGDLGREADIASAFPPNDAWLATVFGVGAGAAGAYGGADSVLLSRSGGASFVFGGELTRPTRFDALNPNPEGDQSSDGFKPSELWPSPWVIGKSHGGAFHAELFADILANRGDFQLSERQFSRSLQETLDCRRYRFDITIFSPLEESDVNINKHLFGLAGTCFERDSFAASSLWPYSVAVTLAEGGKGVPRLRTHRYTRASNLYFVNPKEVIPNLSGLVCSFPESLGVCIGALQQSISEFRFTAARVECLEARYVGPGAP